jgi:hypothetical protein
MDLFLWMNGVVVRLLRRLRGEACPELDRGLRSPRWSAVQKAHLRFEPKCQWCGTRLVLQVHHVIPFHVDPTKELDPKNLITLCERRRCHLKRGHNGNFREYNPIIREECNARKTRDLSARESSLLFVLVCAALAAVVVAGIGFSVAHWAIGLSVLWSVIVGVILAPLAVFAVLFWVFFVVGFG